MLRLPLVPSLRRAYSTVNEAEVAHFSRLSAQWWDEQGEFVFLHRMNPARVQFMKHKVLEIARDEAEADLPPSQQQNPLDGLNILDVGCGGGLLSESLARLGARTLGIDASHSNIAIASHHASHDPKLSHNLTYQHTTSDDLVNLPQRYDIVCSMEVIEHVDNPAHFLSTCAQLLKPGGHLFLSTIARTPLSYFLNIMMAEHVLRQVTVGTHTHSKFINPSELIEFFQKYHKSIGSEVPWISPHSPVNAPTRKEAEVRGIIYNPLQSQWHLAPRGAWGATEANYMFWVRRPKE